VVVVQGCHSLLFIKLSVSFRPSICLVLEAKQLFGSKWTSSCLISAAFSNYWKKGLRRIGARRIFLSGGWRQPKYFPTNIRLNHLDLIGSKGFANCILTQLLILEHYLHFDRNQK
jgi:hypothetical protein